MVNALYLAIRFLKALAGAIGKLFPLASKAILQDNYVDDYTGGADTWEDAFELYTINWKVSSIVHAVIYENLCQIYHTYWTEFRIRIKS